MAEKNSLYCSKCGMNFSPKHPNKVESALKNKDTHEHYCRPNQHFVVRTESVTDDNGHHKTKEWAVH